MLLSLEKRYINQIFGSDLSSFFSYYFSDLGGNNIYMENIINLKSKQYKVTIEYIIN